MKTMISAVALILVAGAAQAQDSAQNRAACMGDAMTFCATYVPDEGRIAACLRQNRARISLACQTALGGAPSAVTKRQARRMPS